MAVDGCQKRISNRLMTPTSSLPGAIRAGNYIGVNITAFGREITLFERHPARQLKCPAFCMFRIDRIYLQVLLCVCCLFATDPARDKDIPGQVTSNPYTCNVYTMYCSTSSCAPWRWPKILDAALACISSCAGILSCFYVRFVPLFRSPMLTPTEINPTTHWPLLADDSHALPCVVHERRLLEQSTETLKVSLYKHNRALGHYRAEPCKPHTETWIEIPKSRQRLATAHIEVNCMQLKSSNMSAIHIYTYCWKTDSRKHKKI